MLCYAIFVMRCLVDGDTLHPRKVFQVNWKPDPQHIKEKKIEASLYRNITLHLLK